MGYSVEERDTSAVRITLIYVLVATVWIFFSDLLLVGIKNPRLLLSLSVVKGMGFVLVTAALLYMLVKRAINRILHTEAQAALVFDGVNDAILLFYLENGHPGRFIAANQAAVERLGYTLSQLKKMEPTELIAPDLRDEHRDAIRELWERGRVVYETCQVAKDGTEIPVEISSRTVKIGYRVMGVAIARDITERKRVERERREQAVEVERDKRRFYRETILAVTGGKFEITDPADARDWIQDPDISVHASASYDLADARHEAMEYCSQAGMEESSMREFELALGESLSNAVKHAGEGWLYVGRKEDSVWTAVVDRGNGIDTFIIPKVALLAGFSTRASMGLGYTLILRVCDNVKLATGPEGTTVVMEKLLKPLSEFDRQLSVYTEVE